MKRRVLFILVTVAFFVFMFSFTVSATDLYVYNGVDINSIQNFGSNISQNASEEGEIILTRYADGTVTRSVYTPSENSDVLLNDGELNVELYL